MIKIDKIKVINKIKMTATINKKFKGSKNNR
jgi:hypothetical protein